MSTPTQPKSYVVLATQVDGRWIETTYETSDKSWTEAIKILKDSKVTYKLSYK